MKGVDSNISELILFYLYRVVGDPVSGDDIGIFLFAVSVVSSSEAELFLSLSCKI